MPATFSILHISDLHFAQSLNNRSAGMTGVANIKALLAVKEYLASNKVDLVVVTGDLATDGHKESLRNARQYLLQESPENSELSLRRSKHNLAVVPGNHDRFLSGWLPLMRSSRNFIDVFPEYSHMRKRATHTGVVRSDSGFSLRLIGIDSCAGTRGVRIARGKAHNEDLEWIAKLFLEDAEAGSDIDVRMLLLHHHLTVPKGHEFSSLTSIRDRNAVFRAMLRGGIDIALYGHEHKFRAWSAPYGDCILKRHIKGRLTRQGWDLTRQVGLCLGGTASQDGADAHTAWRIDIERSESSEGFEYTYKFQLLSSVGGEPLRVFPGHGHQFRSKRYQYPVGASIEDPPLDSVVSRIRGLT